MHIAIDFMALEKRCSFSKGSKLQICHRKVFDRRFVVGLAVVISMGESKQVYQWRPSSNKVDALYDFKR